VGVSSIVQLCAAVQTAVAGVSGIRFADGPFDSLPGGAEPVAVCLPGSGRYDLADSDSNQAAHTLTLLVIKPRVNQRTDWAALKGLGDAVVAALLADVTLGGLAIQLHPIRYTFGDMEIDAGRYQGWVFELDVTTMT
jgi:hypothetical protein